MVVLDRGELEQIALPAVQRPPPPLAPVPAVDLAAGRAAAARQVAAACEEHGFFKVTNHGVPAALLARMDAAAAAFFALPQRDKERLAAPSPLGYSSKRIGRNGDLGWVEYLLLGVTANGAMPMPFSTLPLPAGEEASSSSSCSFRDLVEEYIAAVRRMACEVLELAAEGLGVAERDAFSRLVLDAESDCALRLNHYPPRPDLPPGAGAGAVAGGVTGFGEHTDPQILSVLRSNDTSGLEVALRDGAWAAVPPDPAAFFVNVGDLLQVLTNGRFRSVRHRVMVSSARPRNSMIFFAGPPLRERVAPAPCLLGGGRRSLYRDFTWSEYKSSAYATKLGDNRLCHFEN